MTQHLSVTELADYAGGALRGDELLRVDDHLAGCATCRAQLPPPARLAARVADLRAGLERDDDHPPYAELEAYVDATLAPDARRRVDEHLADCVRCGEDVADLGEAARTTGPAPLSRRTSWLAIAAALLLAAGVAGLIVVNRPGPAGGDPGRSAPAATVDAAVRLHDGPRELTLTATGALSGADDLADSERTSVEAALRRGELAIPDAIAALAGTTGTLMAPTDPPGPFAPIAPIATAVDTTTPLFEWTSHPAAISYVVAVFDAGQAKVAESPPLRAARWSPNVPLARDQIYLWQVRARVGSGDVITPAPPQPEARFAVVSAPAAARLADLRTRYADRPLTLGILLAEAGLVDEAARALAAAAAANPEAPIVARLLRDARGLPLR